jgi:hypothetical protein
MLPFSPTLHLTMKSFQLILLCFVCVAKSYGQRSQGGQIVIEITKEKHKIFTTKVIQWVNARADSSWVPSIEKGLNRSLSVNKRAKRAKKGKYIVSVIFIIDKEGNICDVECKNDPAYPGSGIGIREEVVRAIKKSGKWVTGKGSIVRPYKH